MRISLGGREDIGKDEEEKEKIEIRFKDRGNDLMRSGSGIEKDDRRG